jgi:hypothetical protein
MTVFPNLERSRCAAVSSIMGRHMESDVSNAATDLPARARGVEPPLVTAVRLFGSTGPDGTPG